MWPERAQHWFTCGVGHDMDGPFVGFRDALISLGRKSARFLFAGAYEIKERTEHRIDSIYIFTKPAASRLGFDPKECDFLEDE